MRLMLGRYLRLLDAAARQPELPLRKLLLIAGPKPLRWICANYVHLFTGSLQPFTPHRRY
jgi:hypothetical protein